MKRFFVFSLLLTAITVAFSQTNIGIDYYQLGDYENAKKYLEKDIATNPAEVNFYLGEIAFKEGNMTKAEEYYKKNLAVAPGNFMGEIGLAKLLLKKDIKAAETSLNTVLRTNKKDIDVLL